MTKQELLQPFRTGSPKKYATLHFDGSQPAERIGFVTGLDYMNMTDEQIEDAIFSAYEAHLTYQLDLLTKRTAQRLDTLQKIRGSSMSHLYIQEVESDSIFD